MSVIAQIEKLDAKNFDELRDWFMDHMHGRWEQQIEADSADGKLDFLVEEAAEAERRTSASP